ncbi:alpha/beta hydrolase [Arthrobacter cheniae]|uniref:Alpha/beta hydrolase n=1 Tax=Arthrobacter cheniae TaxID=1258888 RepID=A0A3A5M084_9MICC|nr:alpha/beta hydrolase [Arthrobacter cheniae]RJT77951.1 alpha/beta hydrolase [Arthrobacter cheniae]
MTLDLLAHLSAPEPHRCAVRFYDRTIQVADGQHIRVRVYEPEDVAGITLVWAHGGSWTRGSIDDWHDACLQLATLGRARLVSVGYRLAPKWQHPTAVMDISCAIRWSDTQFGGATYVGGDSAGGTLAAGAALFARDSGFGLAGQILAYPPLDPACTSPSYHQPEQPFPPHSMLMHAWRQYVGTDGTLPRSKYLTPIHEEHLAGVCRTALLVGPSDPVFDDVRALAKKLRDAAVSVSLCEDPWVFHGQFLSTSARANPVHQWVQLELKRMGLDLATNKTPETSTP